MFDLEWRIVPGFQFADRALGAITTLPFETVLDIGSGSGLHAAHFRSLNKQVTTISLEPPADIVGDYLETEVEPHDVVWASHVLEHQLNVNLFLKKCFRDCRKWLAITVPPAKDEIVGGHVSLWNAGLLLYNLVLAGWDCRWAKVLTYGYNISVIVNKKAAQLPQLRMDSGDIERLAPFFPFHAEQGFNGQLQEVSDSVRSAVERNEKTRHLSGGCCFIE